MRCGLPVVLVMTGLVGCGAAKQLVSADDDLTDYRAFRVAAHEGTRLARAQHYLESHPRGEWYGEVRSVFLREEAEYYEAAKTSRARAIEYLVDLPRGPHATAARMLVTLQDERAGDEETDRLVAAAHHTEALLEQASQDRRRVGDLILRELAALLDDRVYGARIDGAPQALRDALGGVSPTTWGSPPVARSDNLFFTIPTPEGSESRVAMVEMTVALAEDRIVEGRIEGVDLFVRWAEANSIHSLDPNDQGARSFASDDVRDILSGALEARLPASRCTIHPGSGQLIARNCDGMSVVVDMGPRAGEADAIVVRGP